MGGKRSSDGAAVDSSAPASKKHKHKHKHEHHDQPQVPDYDFSAPATSASQGLPALPPIKRDDLRTAVFTHPSKTTSQTSTESYDRLEFLGDAYIELMATRLLYAHLPHAPPRRLSTLREQLCRNRTLAAFTTSYGLDTRLAVDSANSITDKTYGDLFEAYVAAVVLCDGFAAAEAWLAALWAPHLRDLGSAQTAAAADVRTAKEKLNSLVYDQKNTQSRLEVMPLREGDLDGVQGTAANQVVRLRLLYRWDKEPWVEVAQGAGVGKKDAGNNAAQQALDSLETNEPLQALIKRKKESDAQRKAAAREREAQAERA